MKTLKSLKGVEILDSSKLKNVIGGKGDVMGGSASQFTNIQSTCDGQYADQSGMGRTDTFDGTTYILGPWYPYKTTSMGEFH